ncbi:MAG: MBL fold metallo-hydrolase [Clostridia bacterium]|nr:MBL fold metallo-hydrolase [Clostridia bacterium]
MNLKFFHVGGACWVLYVDEKIKLACDPFLAPAGTEYNFKVFTSTRTKPPIYDESLFDGIDIWFITHSHADHIDEMGIDKMDKNSITVAQKSLLKLLSKDRFSNLYILDWEQAKSFDVEGYKIDIRAVPAYHGSNFITRTLAGKVNGYFVTITRGADKKSVYITSDTIYHTEVIESIRGKDIDIMIANLGEVRPKSFGGPLTMSVSMLQKFIHELQPKIAIPIHIDDFSHYTTTKEDLLSNGISVVSQGCWITL